MEDILKEIIEADKQARSKVEAKKSEKLHLDETLKTLQQSQSKKALDEVNEQLAVLKKQLDDEYETLNQQMQERLKEECSLLKEKYEANKENWLKTMFDVVNR